MNRANKRHVLSMVIAACMLVALAGAAGCASPATVPSHWVSAGSSAPATNTFVTAMIARSSPAFRASLPAKMPAPLRAAASAKAPAPGGAAPLTTFAVIGDYGVGTSHASDVASMVASWNPSYIIATGDCYYPRAGGSGTAKYDNSTGVFYGLWLKDFTTSGTHYPVGTAEVNEFFPTLGNHDYSDGSGKPSSYLAYFDLPGTGFHNTSGNERYYDFVNGPIHFFALNSNTQEPDGTSATSKQARWLKRQLAASKSKWNIVYDHHPPYSSDDQHGSIDYMRWPFAAWGADAVISGHAHDYERVMQDKIPYFVNGLGGVTRYTFSTPVQGSAVRYTNNWGAQKVIVGAKTITFEFYNVAGKLIDRYSIRAK